MLSDLQSQTFIFKAVQKCLALMWFGAPISEASMHVSQICGKYAASIAGGSIMFVGDSKLLPMNFVFNRRQILRYLTVLEP